MTFRRRKRRTYRKPATRGMIFLPALALPVWGWMALHIAASAIGFAVLGVMVLLSLMIVPALLLCLFFLPTAWTGIIPRSWRQEHRKRHGRENCRSSYIPKFLRHLVFAADGWRCVACGSREKLQVDHFFPWSLGGLTVLFNLVTLCGRCNRIKSNYWMFRRSGRVVYRAFDDAQELADVAYTQAAASLGTMIRSRAIDQAAGILADERAVRWLPTRAIRAAWHL
jgi:HNH endonuclease